MRRLLSLLKVGIRRKIFSQIAFIGRCDHNSVRVGDTKDAGESDRSGSDARSEIRSNW
jgi:hypothetical protein